MNRSDPVMAFALMMEALKRAENKKVKVSISVIALKPTVKRYIRLADITKKDRLMYHIRVYNNTHSTQISMI